MVRSREPSRRKRKRKRAKEKRKREIAQSFYVIAAERDIHTLPILLLKLEDFLTNYFQPKSPLHFLSTKMTTPRTTLSCFCRHHRLLQEHRRRHRRHRSSMLVVTSQKRDPKWGDGYQWGKNSLGKKSRWKSRLILEYEVAREFVWTLGLYDEDDWRDWAKDRRRGCVFIPRDPWNAYEGRGWIGTTKSVFHISQKSFWFVF